MAIKSGNHRARGALKFFRQDGRYDVICTGSLLGVNGYRTPEQQLREKRASIPVGYEDFLEMYPMDFEEWLWAGGIGEDAINLLRTYFDTQAVEPGIQEIPVLRRSSGRTQ